MNFISITFSAFERKFSRTVPYLWGALSAVALTVSNFFVKRLSKEFDSAQIMVFRSLQLAIFSYFLMIWQNMQFHYKSPLINRLLLARALVGTFGLALNYYGLSMIPLSDASPLLQIFPVYTGILATLCLGEKYEKSQLFAALVCLVGVIFIVQPPFIFGSNSQTTIDSTTRIVGSVLILLAGFTGSLVEILLKKAGGKTNAGITTLIFGILGAMFGTVATISQGYVTPRMEHVVGILGAGIFSFLSQMLKNRAFALCVGNPGRVSNMGYLGIVAGYMLDIFVVGNPIDPLSLVGGCCILSCMFIYMYQLYQGGR